MTIGVLEPPTKDRPSVEKRPPKVKRRGGDFNDFKPPHSHRWRWGDGHHRQPESRAYFGVFVAIISVTMFFFPLTASLFILKDMSETWTSISLPPVIWIGTAMLLLSSLTLERSRRLIFDRRQFNRWWGITLFLGLLFLGGQVVAWLELSKSDLLLGNRLFQTFFYVLTAAHGLHLSGGILALLWIIWTRRKGRFGSMMIGRVRAAALYWHFMDALWVGILAVFLIID